VRGRVRRVADVAWNGPTPLPSPFAAPSLHGPSPRRQHGVSRLFKPLRVPHVYIGEFQVGGGGFGGGVLALWGPWGGGPARVAAG
jgi:hypothetical protein